MPETVGVAEGGLEGLVLEPLQVLDIRKLGRNERAVAGERCGDVLENLPLFQRRDGDQAGAAAFCPTGLQSDVVSADGAVGLELHRLLTAQAERSLQQKGRLDVGAFNGLEFGVVEDLRTVAGDLAAFGHAIGGVVAVGSMRTATASTLP